MHRPYLTKRRNGYITTSRWRPKVLPVFGADHDDIFPDTKGGCGDTWWRLDAFCEAWARQMFDGLPADWQPHETVRVEWPRGKVINE